MSAIVCLVVFFEFGKHWKSGCVPIVYQQEKLNHRSFVARHSRRKGQLFMTRRNGSGLPIEKEAWSAVSSSGHGRESLDFRAGEFIVSAFLGELMRSLSSIENNM